MGSVRPGGSRFIDLEGDDNARALIAALSDAGLLTALTGVGTRVEAIPPPAVTPTDPALRDLIRVIHLLGDEKERRQGQGLVADLRMLARDHSGNADIALHLAMGLFNALTHGHGDDDALVGELSVLAAAYPGVEMIQKAFALAPEAIAARDANRGDRALKIKTQRPFDRRPHQRAANC